MAEASVKWGVKYVCTYHCSKDHCSDLYSNNIVLTKVSLSSAAVSLSKVGSSFTTTESSKTSSAVATEQGCKKDDTLDVGVLSLSLRLLGGDNSFDS